jgi:protein-L-isoaspartate(D-aspartate) O-methyltransferase
MTDADRARMIETQLRQRGISDAAVLTAMDAVPRDAFVPPDHKRAAYADMPLPIGEGQTISQPYVVALMLEAARLAPGQRVLEVGAGSGYAAAVMSRIVERVYTIERQPALGQAARRRLEMQGYDNVELRIGDGTLGWEEAAPFDAIVVAAGGPEIPPRLKAQMAVGGRMVIPVGPTRWEQDLCCVTRLSAENWEVTSCGAVRFVPLIGQDGWRAAEDG